MSPNRKRPSGGDRLRLTAVVNHVETAVAVFRVDHGAARDVIFAAAILVHSGAYVGRCWGDLDRLTVRNESAPQAGPASLVSPDLQPVDVPAIDLRSGESRRTNQLVGRDRRDP